MKRLAFTCALSYFAFAIVSHAQNGRPAVPAAAHPYVPVTDEMLWKPDPANWPSWQRSTAKTGDLMWEHRRKLPEGVFQLTASSTCRWRPVHRAWRTRPCVSRRSSSRA